MYDDSLPMLWWSPDPRAVFEFDQFHVSRRLARTLRSGKFTVTSDADFRGVLQGCATASGRRHSTWLTPEMRRDYFGLHQMGFAHSVEVWHDGRLVGGTYGVTIGGVYAGESMFHRETDASKVALACLVSHLQSRGYRLFDIQQINPHTQSLGGTEIPRPNTSAASATPSTSPSPSAASANPSARKRRESWASDAIKTLSRQEVIHGRTCLSRPKLLASTLAYNDNHGRLPALTARRRLHVPPSRMHLTGGILPCVVWPPGSSY